MRAPARVVISLALLCAWMLPAAAATYQVEIIIFAYPQPNADGERFIADEGLPSPQGLAQLGDGAQETGAVVTLLPAASHHLDGVLGALRRGGKYRPLLHASWLQPESGRVRGVFVSAPAAAATAGLAAPDLEQVRGSVRLRVTRFLHVDLDLAYWPGAAPPGMAETGGLEQAEHVRLQESRKIKLNEVHYFDHPLFGALLQVSRAGGQADADAVAPLE